MQVASSEEKLLPKNMAWFLFNHPPKKKLTSKKHSILLPMASYQKDKNKFRKKHPMSKLNARKSKRKVCRIWSTWRKKNWRNWASNSGKSLIYARYFPALIELIELIELIDFFVITKVRTKTGWFFINPDLAQEASPNYDRLHKYQKIISKLFWEKSTKIHVLLFLLFLLALQGFSLLSLLPNTSFKERILSILANYWIVEFYWVEIPAI